MQYSPKLKISISEIKAILEKHDIAGSIVLHTPGNSEYLMHINPTYSCAKLQDGGIRMNFEKIKKAPFFMFCILCGPGALMVESFYWLDRRYLNG